MKKSVSVFASIGVAMMLVIPRVGIAALQACFGERQCSSITGQCPILVALAPSCTGGSMLYYNNTGITSCTGCVTGYELVSKTILVSGCQNPISYKTCEAECNGICPGGCSTTSWTAFSTGYEQRRVGTCNTTTCICMYDIEFRCAAGYYGSSTNGTPGCTACPSGGTSAAGSTAQTNCYIPSGQTGSDATGTYTYTSNCYWKN